MDKLINCYCCIPLKLHYTITMEANKPAGKPRGLKNSSITRVRPIFQRLLQKDPTGGTWLRNLVDLSPRKTKSLSEVMVAPGLLLSDVSRLRPYSDRILKGYDVPQPIDLESCFEKSLAPPNLFLQWLILNLSLIVEPGNKLLKNLSDDRKDFFNTSRPDVQRKAISTALDELLSRKAKNSYRQWWAFEGFTEVDCYLETDKLVLLIEGKRTEKLSSATMWYPNRNQIVRNLEVAAETAKQKQKEFAVLLVTEEIIDFDLADKLEKGLPHFSKKEQHDLGEHFLGCITWKAICDQTGIDFQDIPENSKVAAIQILCR